MSECRCATRIFQGIRVGERFEVCRTWAFDKYFVKNTRKRSHIEKSWEFFLLDTPKYIFWMENLTQWWIESGSFFLTSWHFFRFSNRAGEASPLLPSCMSVSVDEYASISRNMVKYPWKCLNKMFWLRQGFEYAWSPYMFDRL